MPKTKYKSRLISTNVKATEHRTSVKLEPELKESFQQIATESGQSLSALCRLIEGLQPNVSLTSAIRIYIVNYWQTKADKNG